MTTRPSERAFGLSVGCAFLGLAALTAWRGRTTLASAFATLGILLIAFGALAPGALRIPNRIWSRFAGLLGWINSRILLTIFFALVLTPVGVLMRATGRNPLRATRGSSNWRPYPARRRDARHYEHLF